MRKRNHHPFVIAVDIDETVLRSFDVLVAHLNQTHETTHKREDLTEHDWEKIEHLLWTQEEVDNGWDTLFRDPQKINQIHHIVDGAREGVQELRAAGAKVIAITGRGRRAHKSTRHLIDTFFSDLFSSVYYVDYRHNSPINKGQLAKQHHVKVAIDDNPAFLREFENEGIDTYGLNTPWNQEGKRAGLQTKFFDRWSDIVADIKSSYTLELTRLARSSGSIAPETTETTTHAIQDMSHHEVRLVSTNNKEQHLSVIEPHSHDIVLVGPHEHDLILSTQERSLTSVDPSSQQITVASDHSIDIIRPMGENKIDTKTVKKTRRKAITQENLEVAAE